MRAGLSRTLVKRLRRADVAARPIIEAIVQTAEDVRRRKDQWNGLDSTTGITVLDDGGIRLAASISAALERTTHSALTQDLGPTPVFDAVRVLWTGPESADLELHRVKLYLDPDVSGAGKEVDTWVLQAYGVTAYRADGTINTPYYSVVPMGDPVRVVAGASAGLVTFDYTTQPTLPRPKSFGVPGQAPQYGFTWFQSPVSLFVVSAYKSDGTAAGNVGLAYATGGVSGGVGTMQLNTISAFVGSGPTAGYWKDGGNEARGPRGSLETASFTAATVGFTGAGNQLDLGASPGGTVEFVGRAEIPPGAAVTFEVRNDADTAWVAFQDGDTPAELAGVTAKQTYKVRVTLTPDSAGDVTPTVREIGVRDLTVTDFDRLMTVRSARWAVDPVLLRGEIGEATFVGLRDGLRDYRDRVTQLLSENDVGAIALRVWVGHPDIPRADWLHVDTWLLDDTDPQAAAIGLVGLGVLQELRQALPVFDAGAGERAPLEQANVTLKAASDAILDNEIGLAGRYRGQGIEDTTQVSKIIDDSDAKRELDALAYLAGGAWTHSQGRVRFAALLTPRAVVARFRSEEIEVLSASPGHRQRIVELFIRYDWDDTAREYRAELRAFNSTALTALGRARIDPPTWLEDDVARWIDTQALAQAVGNRVVRYFGPGLMLWRFRTTYAWPELEIGDVIAIETDKFVAKDPLVGRALKGRLWAQGVIVEVGDVLGTEFGLWVRSYADIFPSDAAVDRTKLLVPRVEAYFTPVDNNPGQLRVTLGVEPAATLYYQVQDWGTAIPDPGDASWITYQNPFTISQLESTDRQLAVYADNNGARSGIRVWRVDKDTAPEVSLTLSEPAANIPRAAWTPDDDVVWVKLYLGKNLAGNGWPTLNNNSDGILDESKLVGTLHVREDGGSWGRTGSPLVDVLDSTGTRRTGIGGVAWEDRVTGYTTNDVVKVIAVPIDRVGTVGDRATASLTIAGGAAPAIDSLNANKSANGTSCASPWTVDLVGNVNAAVSDGSHDMEYYFRRDGGAWQLIFTDPTPATNDGVTQTKNMESFVDAAGDSHSYDFKAELVPNGGGSPLDTKVTTKPITLKLNALCPLS